MIDVYGKKENGWIVKKIPEYGYKMRFLYYSRRGAIKKMRQDLGIERKHINMIGRI